MTKRLLLIAAAALGAVALIASPAFAQPDTAIGVTVRGNGTTGLSFIGTGYNGTGDPNNCASYRFCQPFTDDSGQIQGVPPDYGYDSTTGEVRLPVDSCSAAFPPTQIGPFTFDLDCVDLDGTNTAMQGYVFAGQQSNITAGLIARVSGPFIGPDCNIGPIYTAFTTGTDGVMTGEHPDAVPAGDAKFVNGSAAIPSLDPAPDKCGPVGAQAINQLLCGRDTGGCLPGETNARFSTRTVVL